MAVLVTRHPAVDVNLSAPAVNLDPFPHLKCMRDIAPVVYSAAAGLWMTTTFAAARRVLSDDSNFPPHAALFEAMYSAPTFEIIDNPRHNEQRGIWEPGLQRGSIEKQRTDDVEQIVDQLFTPVLQRLRSGETVDMMADLTNKIPAYVIAQLLGIPASDFDLFSGWSHRLGGTVEAAGLGPTAEAAELQRQGEEATASLCAYAGEHLERRRRTGATDDMLGQLANTDVEMPEDQKRATVTMAVFGGQDTTSKLMALTMLTLAEHPDQRRMITNDRTLVPQAIEEVIRFLGPVQVDPRLVNRDVELGGVHIPEGDTVFAMLGAANRDPARWETPDIFDVLRPRKAHVGFGFGIHNCIGMHLVRLEMKIWLNRLLDEMPEYELAFDPLFPLEYGTNMMTRGPKVLPVKLGRV